MREIDSYIFVSLIICINQEKKNLWMYRNGREKKRKNGTINKSKKVL